jgi:hypothetical protein
VNEIEKRQSERRDIVSIVHMSTGLGPPLECSLKNLSKLGARIAISNPRSAPQEFEVVLKEGLARWCRVMWRSEGEIGIEFIVAPQSLRLIGAKEEPQ